MPGVISVLRPVILKTILRLRSFFSLVLPTILMSSPPSLAMIQVFYVQTKGTFGYAKVAIVASKVAYQRQELMQSLSRRNKKLRKISAK